MAGEEVVLLTDVDTDQAVVEALVAGLEDRSCIPVVARLPRYQVREASAGRVAGLLASADAVIELTSTFIGSSRARQDATARGVRYLAMPGVVADTFRLDGPLDATSTSWVADGDRRGRVGGRERLPDHDAGRNGPARVGRRKARAGAVRRRARGGPVHGTTRRRGRHRTGGGLPHGVVMIDADFLFMGQGPLAEPVALQFKDGVLLGVEGAESGRLTEMVARCDDRG